ncbi:Hvo_1808 family surface protein [Halobaculum sp. MBLA0143]|uniref:Hvo_1808 family surface protein n=1 Tax=Halobaculum sp. MBLA0143 TaxID=3079933 RepID=UPI0035251BE6
MKRPITAVVVCLCLVLAGCGGGGSPGDGPEVTAAAATDSGESDAAVSRMTVDDELGVEDHVEATAELDITPSDGLTDRELEDVLDRTMARVELIRGLEFTGSVDIRVVSRENFRGGAPDRSLPPRGERVERQQYEALFAVGENTSYAEAYRELSGSSLLGFYDSRADEIVLVSDTENPTVNTRTLAHELVHALQARHFERTVTEGFDRNYALRGLREGDARYVERLYAERCDTEWSCLPVPDDGGGDGVDTDTDDDNEIDYERRLLPIFYQPYAEGTDFVHELYERGGWEAVNAAYDDPPTTTEQTTHPETYPTETAVRVREADRSGEEWWPLPGADNRTLGELGVYATLLNTGYVSFENFTQRDGPYAPQTYAVEASTGWAGDTLVAYTDSDRDGYVWRLRWDTTADAREFAAAYREGLERQGARSVGNDTYVIPDGPFADAFVVTRDGDTVVVTNAPTVEDVKQIRASE